MNNLIKPRFHLKKVLTFVTLLILIILITFSINPTNQAFATKLPNQLELLSSSNNSASPSLQDASKVLTLEDVRLIIKKAKDAWMTGNADEFANLFTPDGELIVPGERWVGPAAIRQVVTDFSAAYSVINIDIRRIIIDGNQAVVEWHWQDKEKATGTRSAADDAIVIEFKAGQISRWREYIDTKTPVSQG